MSALVTTLIAAVSACAAVGTLVAYLYFVRRSDWSAAREEALALAETREEIAELRVRLEALERRHRRMKAGCDKRIHKLQRALEHDRAEAREQAYQAQRLYTATFADLLEGLRADLAAVPPDHDAALARIRQLLTRPPAAVP
jgi:hypothetical protein